MRAWASASTAWCARASDCPLSRCRASRASHCVLSWAATAVTSGGAAEGEAAGTTGAATSGDEDAGTGLAGGAGEGGGTQAAGVTISQVSIKRLHRGLIITPPFLGCAHPTSVRAAGPALD